MVEAWFMDDSEDDQRLPHKTDPPQMLNADELFRATGVEAYKIDTTQGDQDSLLLKIREERGYSYVDEIICSPEELPNYKEKLKAFFEEHLHTDEEIRLVLEGSGYFDVRNLQDRWVRVAVAAGDLLILPAGIYHRFTLDSQNYIRAKRYFVGEPVWTPFNRPADDLLCRKTYVEKLKNGFVVDP